MNILKYPDEALPGAVLSAKEFEESAIDAKWMEDLMDQAFLEPGEFLREAIGRANAARTPQNLHQWVATPDDASVFLVTTPIVPSINRLRALAQAQKKQMEITRTVILDLIRAGSTT